MKKMFLCAAILFSCLAYNSADAQLRINLGFNIGSQPEWGPVGYTHAEYYYMPAADAYYDVPRHQYVYYENNVWIHAGALPPRYHFDPYHSYKVVVNQRNPWEHQADYRTRYSNYRDRQDQQIIRDSRDDRYRNHWNGDRENGDNRGQGRGHGDREDGGDRGQGRDHGDRGNGGDRGHGEKKGHGDKGNGDHGDN
jgi:hypothetical protein